MERAEIERAMHKPTESLDAYALYLRGLATFYQFDSRQAVEEELRLFKGAIELDPDFAAAYGRAAMCYSRAKGNRSMLITPDVISEASMLAQRAIELGKDDAVALASGGWVAAFVAGDLEGGAALIDRALALNSNLTEVWHHGGWMKVWLGEPKLAIDRFARAMRLSPIDPWIIHMWSAAAHAHFFLGDYDEAASAAATALRDNPNFQPGLRISAASNAMAGRLEQARNVVARLQQLNPGLRVSNFRDVLGPYRHAEYVSRYQEAMRQAGLPE